MSTVTLNAGQQEFQVRQVTAYLENLRKTQVIINAMEGQK